MSNSWNNDLEVHTADFLCPTEWNRKPRAGKQQMHHAHLQVPLQPRAHTEQTCTIPATICRFAARPFPAPAAPLFKCLMYGCVDSNNDGAETPREVVINLSLVSLAFFKHGCHLRLLCWLHQSGLLKENIFLFFFALETSQHVKWYHSSPPKRGGFSLH